jgi:hypothetical protein
MAALFQLRRHTREEIKWPSVGCNTRIQFLVREGTFIFSLKILFCLVGLSQSVRLFGTSAGNGRTLPALDEYGVFGRMKFGRGN